MSNHCLSAFLMVFVLLLSPCMAFDLLTCSKIANANGLLMNFEKNWMTTKMQKQNKSIHCSAIQPVAYFSSPEEKQSQKQKMFYQIIPQLSRPISLLPITFATLMGRVSRHQDTNTTTSSIVVVAEVMPSKGKQDEGKKTKGPTDFVKCWSTGQGVG